MENVNLIIIQRHCYIVIADDRGFLTELMILFIQYSCQLQCRGNISLVIIERKICPLKNNFYKNIEAQLMIIIMMWIRLIEKFIYPKGGNLPVPIIHTLTINKQGSNLH